MDLRKESELIILKKLQETGKIEFNEFTALFGEEWGSLQAVFTDLKKWDTYIFTLPEEGGNKVVITGEGNQMVRELERELVDEKKERNKTRIIIYASIVAAIASVLALLLH